MLAVARNRMNDPVRSKYSWLVALAAGYTLIVATVWAHGLALQMLLPLDLIFFLTAALITLRASDFELPELTLTAVVSGIGLAIAGMVLLAGLRYGTLHSLFGKQTSWLYGLTYFVWAIAQQWIQQSFFFSRLERILPKGLDSFVVAAMFGLAHLPNPILAPVTFVGGWILSEVFRRYRHVVPLGIAHALIGLAIGFSVPDHLNHQMEVGMGYIDWRG
jgi:membrane protease YdiL (CAAX protease family)